MSRRITWLAALALVGCGLSVVGTGLDVAEPDGGSPDASADGAAVDGNEILDASADMGIHDATPLDAGAVALEGGCFVLVTDNFSPPDPRWALEGYAVFDGGAAVLVDPQQQHAGGIFIAVEAGSPPTRFEATFTMIMRDDAGPDAAFPPADGVSLVWASDLSQPPLGGTGSACGFCPNSNSGYVGPQGAALVLHVLSGTGVSVRESDGSTCAESNVEPYPFSQAPIPVSASISTSNVDGSVGMNALDFVVVNPVPIRWIGFTAATGGAVAQFSVTNVAITMCP